MAGDFDRLLQTVIAHPGRVRPQDIEGLLQAGPDEEARLFAAADEARSREVGDEVHLRGIIEFANYCRMDCHYCGIRISNHAIERYRMPLGAILAAARQGAGLGVGTIILQSGEDAGYGREDLAALITAIARLPVAVTLSLGERSYADLKVFRQAGADRYLLKHETADPGLFRRLRPGTTLGGRLRQLRRMKALGYQVGSGTIVGLPGQTPATLARDIILLRDLAVDMVGIGPLVPHPSTPLGHLPPGPVDLTLRCVAVTRLCLPRAHIAATTALATLDPIGRERALQAGANVVMPNLTPLEYRRRYTIYPGKACLEEPPEHCLGCLRRKIESLGRTVGKGRGDSPEWLKGVAGRVQ